MGDHPAALISGALAAKLGLSVLIVPLAENSRVAISSDGRVHDSETTWFPSLAEASGPHHLVRATLEYLGTTSSEMTQVISRASENELVCVGKGLALDRPYQSWIEQWHWSHSSVSRDNLASMQGILEVSDDLFRHFWSQLPERLTWKESRKQDGAPLRGEGQARETEGPRGAIRTPEKDLAIRLSKSGVLGRKSSAQISKLLSSPVQMAFRDLGLLEMIESANGIWDFLGPVSPREKTLFDWLHMAFMARSSNRVLGGAQSLRQLLLRLALRNGADYASDRDARRVFLRKDRFSGIQISGSGTVITAEGGVYGARMTSLLNRLVGADSRRLQQKLERPSTQSTPVSLDLTLSLRVTEPVAAAMTDRRLFVDPEVGALEVEKVSMEPYTGDRTQGALLLLRSRIPFAPGSSDLDLDVLLQRAARMERAWSELSPGCEKGILYRFPDHTRREQGRADLELIYPRRNQASLSAHHVGHWSSVLAPSTPFKNLFLVSAETYAQLGAGFGPWVGAFEATSWIAHRSGLPGPMQVAVSGSPKKGPRS